MKRSLLVLLVCLLGSTACSSTEAGDSCDDEAAAACESDTVGLFCDDGVFKQIQCRGVGGCSTNSSQVVCAFGQFRAGDACTKESENVAQCDATNPNQALRCNSGTVKALACNACEVRTDGVYCLP